MAPNKASQTHVNNCRNFIYILNTPVYIIKYFSKHLVIPRAKLFKQSSVIHLKSKKDSKLVLFHLFKWYIMIVSEVRSTPGPCEEHRGSKYRKLKIYSYRSCRQNRKCGNFTLSFCKWLHGIFPAKMIAARALFLIQPIKFFICPFSSSMLKLAIAK